MGRYDLRPLRIHKLAARQLEAQQISSAPPWASVVAAIPPSTVLTRTQPIQHNPRPQRSRRRRNSKPSRMFQPQPLSYSEDALRTKFFADHPWELARPRLILEDDGRDGERVDWSKGIAQPARAVDGESVVQRTQYLLHAPRPMDANGQRLPSLTLAQAYDVARKELYAFRHSQEIQRRIALEEARSTGAWFGPSALDMGMALEDKTWDKMREWAGKKADELQMKRSSAYTGNQDPDDIEGDAPDEHSDAMGSEVV